MSEGETRLGILISGRGSNMEALADAVADGRVPATIALVVSNVADAPGLALAAARGLPTALAVSRGRRRAEHDTAVSELLVAAGVNLVCLAGYMRLLSAGFVGRHRGRILNVHPSLLPAFPGLHAQRQALEHGVRVAGATVHLVDEELDHGAILVQGTVPVLDDDTEDTLSARILEVEHRLYPEAVRLVAEGRFRLDGRRVIRS